MCGGRKLRFKAGKPVPAIELVYLMSGNCPTDRLPQRTFTLIGLFNVRTLLVAMTASAAIVVLGATPLLQINCIVLFAFNVRFDVSTSALFALRMILLVAPEKIVMGEAEDTAEFGAAN